MPPEDLKIHINRSFGVAIQAKELADPKIVYLIAEASGEAAGYAKLHKDCYEEVVTGERCLEIARFYFLQEWIGRGVSQKLMQAVLDFGRENGFDTIWLGVWRFNERAERFYQKWGFEKVGEHIFMLGNDPQNDWVMQRKI
jgi:GNAT superfamily N-acetyltransferase